MTKIQTHSGLQYDYLNPTPEMINIKDIAHACHFLHRHIKIAMQAQSYCTIYGCTQP